MPLCIKNVLLRIFLIMTVCVVIGCSQNDQANGFGIINDCEPVVMQIEFTIKNTHAIPIKGAKMHLWNKPGGCPQSKSFDLTEESNEDGLIRIDPIDTGIGDKIFVDVQADGYKRYESRFDAIKSSTDLINIVMEAEIQVR